MDNKKISIPVLRLLLEDGFLSGTLAAVSMSERRTAEDRRQWKIANFAFAGAIGAGQFEKLKKEATNRAAEQAWLSWFLNRLEEKESFE